MNQVKRNMRKFYNPITMDLCFCINNDCVFVSLVQGINYKFLTNIEHLMALLSLALLAHSEAVPQTKTASLN